MLIRFPNKTSRGKVDSGLMIKMVAVCIVSLQQQGLNITDLQSFGQPEHTTVLRVGRDPRIFDTFVQQLDPVVIDPVNLQELSCQGRRQSRCRRHRIQTTQCKGKVNSAFVAKRPTAAPTGPYQLPSRHIISPTRQFDITPTTRKGSCL